MLFNREKYSIIDYWNIYLERKPMSVTFFPVEEPTKFELSCVCGERTYQEETLDYPGAVFLQMTLNLHPENRACSAYPPNILAVFPFQEDANFSNMNARLMLNVLGFSETDLAGETTAEDFLGRILLAEALEKPNTLNPTLKGTTIFDPDYFQTKLEQLHTIADYAKVNNLKIAWG